MASKKKVVRKKTKRTIQMKKAPSAPPSKVEALANSILADIQEEENLSEFAGDSDPGDLFEITEDLELTPPKPLPSHTFVEEPVPVVEPEEDTRPVYLPLGTSIKNPFVVKAAEHEIYSYLNDTFGFKDGSYFVHGDNTQSRIQDGSRRKYKTLLVEDQYGNRYTIWFDVTVLSFLA